MRPIKLRAWDNVNRRMLFFSDLAWEDEYDLLYFGEGRLDVSVGDNLDFMLPTGLTDKNDKEAYHKDLCNHPSGLYSIEWIALDAKFALIQIQEGCILQGNTLDMRYIGEMEIIGNSYEKEEP